jgi:tryptophan-rich sensory protein
MTASRRDLLGLAVFVALVAAVAVAASLTTIGAADEYESLEGPAWAPPGWLFGPVWTILYGMIAVSGWLAWRTGMRPRDPGLVLWATQLALNGLWSPLFFGLGWRATALVCILLLDAAVAATIVVFARRHRVAAGLLVPYMAWILFATALNAAYWWLNR